jgi:hypothetical protein
MRRLSANAEPQSTSANNDINEHGSRSSQGFLGVSVTGRTTFFSCTATRRNLHVTVL